MLFSRESLSVQTHAQGHEQMANSYGSFVVTDSVQLPIVQTYKIPAANTPIAGLLTRREIEILELLGTGLSVKGAARELDISPGTVKWHVK
ncbi:MAG: LuxR C-terminal-related transcriptional regulator, partial [Pseudomonadota bacterium]